MCSLIFHLSTFNKQLIRPTLSNTLVFSMSALFYHAYSIIPLFIFMSCYHIFLLFSFSDYGWMPPDTCTLTLLRQTSHILGFSFSLKVKITMWTWMMVGQQYGLFSHSVVPKFYCCSGLQQCIALITMTAIIIWTL